MAFTAAVLGLGNIGRHIIQALELEPDAECIGVVRRRSSIGTSPSELRGVQDFTSFDDLCETVGKPDVVLLGLPSRQCPGAAHELLSRGVCTVDGFDMHDRILEVVGMLEEQAELSHCVSITAAGWDPGTDSVVRALFETMVPKGKTLVNFGRGMSMGRSAAARAVEGVADALAFTVPLGGGRHSRFVHVLLEQGYCLDKVTEALSRDPYFANDLLTVQPVASKEELDKIADHSSGVSMERNGSSGFIDEQHLHFEMRINNPALTAQVLVAAARAAVRLRDAEKYGCYTLLDIPPVMLLPGEREDNIARLV